VRLLPLPKAAHARLQIDMNLSLFWFPPYEEKVTRGKKGRKCENDQRELKCPLISFLRPKKPHQSLIVHQSLGVRTIEWRCNLKICMEEKFNCSWSHQVRGRQCIKNLSKSIINNSYKNGRSRTSTHCVVLSLVRTLDCWIAHQKLGSDITDHRLLLN